MDRKKNEKKGKERRKNTEKVNKDEEGNLIRIDSKLTAKNTPTSCQIHARLTLIANFLSESIPLEFKSTFD